MRISLATEPGTPGLANEDAAAATDTVAVVLDGVTTLPGYGSGCRHGTVWFVRQLADRILVRAGVPEAGLDEALHAALTDVVELHGGGCDLSLPDPPSATLAILRETEEALEYLVLADCTVVVDIAGTVQEITDDRLLRLHLPERKAVLADPTPEAYAALMEAKRARRNRRGGYWVAASEPEAARHALTGRYDRHRVRRAALMTDGVSCAVDRYGLTDWPGLLDDLDRAGPEAAIQRIRRAEAEDPDGIRWARGKTHDDAAIAYCRPG
ncbi:protein phosphatase 2C domain-containing protein [Streptomyces sp. NPDC004647]|uniref:protein phosphatase 2C domain-containing protein n=1 Tax=Streptomyces sp. NPDC004647 TaxID=3154671 RepID=UPI0033AECB17